jgi:hypothetical protein
MSGPNLPYIAFRESPIATEAFPDSVDPGQIEKKRPAGLKPVFLLDLFI